MRYSLAYHMGCIALGLVIFFSACSDPSAPDFLKTSGPSHTVTRSILSLPKKLVINNGVEVVLVPGLAQIELTGPRNILPKVETLLEGEVLTLSDKNTVNWVRRYETITLRIPADSLTSVLQLGFGSIKCADTLRVASLSIGVLSTADVQILAVCEAIALDLNGYGALNLAGSATYTYAALRKYARLEAPQFKTFRADLEQDGAGDALLFVQDSIYISQQGPGCALFFGQPKVGKEGGKVPCIRFL
jgi:hypothetical protein